MVSIAQNKSFCIAPQAVTARDFQASAALAQTATACGHGILQGAKERCQRQLAWNQRSMKTGLLLGVAALAVVCYLGNLAAYWPLAAAAAVELGFVPWYTSAASGRLRRMIALIELDMEEGFVRDGKGRVRMLLGVFPILEDGTTRTLRLAAAGRAAFEGLREGERVTYRFAARSRLVLSIRAEERFNMWTEPSDSDCRNAEHRRCRDNDQVREPCGRSAASLTWPTMGVAWPSGI